MDAPPAAKTAAIMQPYWFPYLGYFQLIHAADVFVLYDNLGYITYGWVSRNRLLGAGGEPFYFIVPVRRKKSVKKIRDARIWEDGRWRRKLRSSLVYDYGKAPFFEETLALVEEVLALETDSLSELNKHGIVQSCKHLGIRTTILADARFDALEEDLARRSLGGTRAPAGFSSTKVARVIEVCKALAADGFVNPAGGEALYPRDEFSRHGIAVSFLEMAAVRYPQHNSRGRFHPRLSILDVLMNCGREGTAELLDDYVLV